MQVYLHPYSIQRMRVDVAAMLVGLAMLVIVPLAVGFAGGDWQGDVLWPGDLAYVVETILIVVCRGQDVVSAFI